MYKTALASGVETPEQRLMREMLTRQSGSTRVPGKITVNVGPDGKPSSARERHMWLQEADGTVDYTNKRNYLGPVTGAEPGGAGGDPKVQQRLWYQQAVRETMSSPELQAFGKLIRDPATGELNIEWTDPVKGRAEFDRLLGDRIRAFQQQDILPTPFLGIGGEGEAAPVERPKVIP